MVNIYLNPKQKLFMRALEDKTTHTIGFGGAKKGGKSWVARYGLIMRCVRYRGTNHLLLRQTMGEVRKNHRAEIQRLCRKLKIRTRYNTEDNCFEFLDYTDGGEPSRLYLGYAEDIKDAWRYQGTEWLTIMYDEATEFIEGLFADINKELIIAAHARNEDGSPAVGKIIYTCNPIGIGKRWMKTNVLDAALRGEPGIVWIYANYKDNVPFDEDNPDFAPGIQRQFKDEPWKVAALLDGDWNSDTGKFFVFDSTEGGKNVKKLQIPYWAKIYAGVDYGYSASAFAVVYAARWQDRHVNPLTKRCDRHFHIFAEIYERYLEADQQAKRAKELEHQLQLPERFFRYADPATGNRIEGMSDETPRTIRLIWDNCKWFTTPAIKHAKASGLTVIRRMLKSGELTIDPDCMALIQELDDAVHAKDARGKILPHTDPNLADDACFVAGTQVATHRGDVAIEDVQAGDFVLTRKGYREVTAAGMTNANAPVFDVELSNGNVITCTAAHPIWIDGKGFTRTDALRYNDCVQTVQSLPSEVRECNPLSSQSASCITSSKRLYSMVSPIASTLTSDLTAEVTLPQVEARRKKRCIGRSGSFITALSRKVATYITKTRTSSTTRLRIWSVSRLASTCSNTNAPTDYPSAGWQLRKRWLQQLHGTSLTLLRSGIENMHLSRGSGSSPQSLMCVSNAEQGLRVQKPLAYFLPNFAATSARRGTVGTQGLTMSSASAITVGQSSQSTSMSPSRTAPVHVLRVRGSGTKPVYNLTVKDEHEFFANGVLVHNCDALRYLICEVFGLNYAASEESVWDDVPQLKLVTVAA